MALVYSKQSELGAAMIMYEKALPAKRDSLGPEHAEIGDVHYNMANIKEVRLGKSWSLQG